MNKKQIMNKKQNKISVIEFDKKDVFEVTERSSRLILKINGYSEYEKAIITESMFNHFKSVLHAVEDLKSAFKE